MGLYRFMGRIHLYTILEANLDPDEAFPDFPDLLNGRCRLATRYYDIMDLESQDPRFNANLRD